MTDLMRKTRTISLRISEQEFEALKSLHLSCGAKSISELARTAMHAVITEPARQKPLALELKVQEMYGKLSVLDGEVARLAKIVKAELAKRQANRHEND